ncbi:MAG: glycerophosphodiester phosphodiesterase [Bdellovibrionaceae bacterium]|nr:glycerophosphodiester phosphodiesterase [Pseudobdellovibrionaceae bacterium]MBX3033905.1 glycerophosphodiester phosphodiesterase [Pseudobdellovibrionaceae bacterium]
MKMTSPIWRLIRAEPWPSAHRPLPLLQAHRGYWAAGFQENTTEAFRAARLAGFEMCELDVRLSKDGVAVVFHDEDLSRLGGREDLIQTMTAEELRRLAKAPALKDVLVDASVTESFNIELKSPLKGLGRLEAAVVEAVRAAKAESRVIFSSFNPFSLALCSRLAPEVPRALLVTEQKEKGNSWPLRKLLFAPFLSIHLLNLDERMLTPEVLAELRRREIPFAVWTVNDPGHAHALLRAGARSLITDKLTPASLPAEKF